MNEKLLQKLSELNICIVSHIFSSGPALDLEEYLKDKVKSLFFIGHPFPYRSDIRNFYRHYNGGKLTEEHNAREWKLPEALFYLKDALYTFIWALSQKTRINLFIGSDNFSAYLGLILKRMGKVEDVVLYTIDYMPTRFKNPIMNFLYHYFDKTCLKECEVIWNVSQKMAEARQKQKNIGGEGWAPQILVPLGIWHERIPKLSFKDKERYRLVFLGHVLEKQGLDIVVDSMPALVKKLSRIKLIILGAGPHESSLKKKAKKLKVKNCVEFKGYIEDHHEVELELAKSSIGIAMYKPDPDSFTYFADPAKLKNYLSAGLPIVLTNVPPIATDLEKEKCAIISRYSKEDFIENISKLLGNTEKLKEYGDNAVHYADKFDWNKVFLKALHQTLLP